MVQAARRHIVLVGFMGSGKSVVGRRLAKELGLHFIDTDRCVEERAGKTVAEIFMEEGGARRFRTLEAAAIREIIQGEPSVISTGGGALLHPKNLTLLSEKGTLLWLKARPDLILERVQKNPGKRPLLNKKGVPPDLLVQRLLAEREPYYRRAAFSIDTSDLRVAEVVAEIKERIREGAGDLPPSPLG